MVENSIFISIDHLIDKDGNALPGAVAFCKNLYEEGKTLTILTNQTTRSVETLALRMNEAGFRTVRADNFYSSTMAAIDTLRSINVPRIRISYLGNKTMRESILQAGFELDVDGADFVFIGTQRTAGAEDYSYYLKMIKQGAEIICLDDSRTDYANNKEFVGPGAVCAMLEYASAKKVYHFEFPNSVSIKRALSYAQSDKISALLIGSAEEVKAASSLGICSALITQSDEEVDIYQLGIRPNYVISQLDRLLG